MPEETAFSMTLTVVAANVRLYGKKGVVDLELPNNALDASQMEALGHDSILAIVVALFEVSRLANDNGQVGCPGEIDKTSPRVVCEAKDFGDADIVDDDRSLGSFYGVSGSN
jgi:hypothetical protein